MRTSTYPIALGVGLFVLPIPGTFITGAALTILGVVARWFGW